MDCYVQVDLTISSIRPGRDQEWLHSFTEELLRAVSSSSADIDVHCGSWSHDIEQARRLPSSKVTSSPNSPSRLPQIGFAMQNSKFVGSCRCPHAK